MGVPSTIEGLTMRPATKADLDAITWVNEAGFPDDPGCPYKFPYRAEYPDDFRKWSRIQYEEYFNQPEKYMIFVVTVPVLNDDGKCIVDKPISFAVWDMAVETKSTSGDRGINERRDANPEHMRTHASTTDYAIEKYFAHHANRRIHLEWVITHPEFRRRGAAAMLCNWGLKEASKRGWAWTVTATPTGKLLYEHLGCKVLGTEIVRVQGEDEFVTLDGMERSPNYTTWQAYVARLVCTLAAGLSLGSLYYFSGRN